MSLTRRLDRAAGLPAAYRLIDALLLAVLAAALAACYAAGMAPAAVAAVALASVGLEFAVGRVVTDGLLRGLELADEAPPRLRRTAAEVAADLGVATPSVVVDRESAGGVNVLGDGDRTVLVASAALAERLDDAALRAVVAHELAHRSLGHLHRVPLRAGVAHAVGLAAFWLLALRHLPPGVAAVAGGAFLVAGVGRSNDFNLLLYVLASGGVVVLVRALAARASRLEECHADDVAVAATSATDFCTGLYAVGALGDDADDAVAGGSPFGSRRTRLERLTAEHPSIESRLARYGLGPDEVAEGAGVERPADD
ncbi:M48 family metallopeptidase [Halosimplex pelagicum]|uniref:M48 family metalloprotease n=1 Tax=Halosimplex pelagicum TaxID=869886 RepID=A0A7D5SV13_9EURY|nr:M48 family metalloprotease [Halosimplex pelagicum]QLH81847.1 M48 family metalloprotease [Halosimplex pelagicum]